LKNTSFYNRLDYMKPEETVRLKIDQFFEAAGWQVQNLRELNLGASMGIAVHEVPVKC
jgi:type I restriction enzyme R subunit